MFSKFFNLHRYHHLILLKWEEVKSFLFKFCILLKVGTLCVPIKMTDRLIVAAIIEKKQEPDQSLTHKDLQLVLLLSEQTELGMPITVAAFNEALKSVKRNGYSSKDNSRSRRNPPEVSPNRPQVRSLFIKPFVLISYSLSGSNSENHHI